MRGRFTFAVVLGIGLAGCPGPRTFEVRVYDFAKTNSTEAGIALRGRIENAEAKWVCPTLPSNANPEFQRSGDVLVAAVFADVDLTCAIEVRAPGFAPVTLPVRDHCVLPAGERCGGFHAAVALMRVGEGGAPAIPMIVPHLDAPARGTAAGAVQTVLAIDLAADGTRTVDGRPIANDDELLAEARQAASTPPTSARSSRPTTRSRTGRSSASSTC